MQEPIILCRYRPVACGGAGGEGSFSPNLCVLGKLILVMPATNAVNERSFSALKRVKTYLRATTGDSRLNHLMILHAHKDKTDATEKANRKQFFGKFLVNDVSVKVSFLTNCDTNYGIVNSISICLTFVRLMTYLLIGSLR